MEKKKYGNDKDDNRIFPMDEPQCALCQGNGKIEPVNQMILSNADLPCEMGPFQSGR